MRYVLPNCMYCNDCQNKHETSLKINDIAVSSRVLVQLLWRNCTDCVKKLLHSVACVKYR